MKANETDDDGGFWDMFCEDHFEEAKAHIIKKYPKHDVMWGDALMDQDDDDESMECGYPECTKRSKYEIYWMDTSEWDGSSDYKPLEENGR